VTPETLLEMRSQMKLCKAVPNSEGTEEEAAVVNQLIPVIVDGITDAELEEMFTITMEFLITNLLSSLMTARAAQLEKVETTSPVIVHRS